MAVKTYKKGDNTKLSKNFSVNEFRCGLGRGCSCTTTLIDDQLVKYLQRVRDEFDAPVTLTSAYRCESYNRSIGGAVGSRHSKGQAADIVVSGVAPLKVAQFLESIGCKGIGLYEGKDGNFVHCDTRTTKSFWYGHAQAYRSTFGSYKTAPSTTPASSSSSSGYSLKEFVTDVQKAVGANPDGIAGPETLSKTKTLSKSYNSRHALVKHVQERLIALGYNPGKADGVYGDQTAYAVANYQQKNGCVADGIISAKAQTWQKLLGMC